MPADRTTAEIRIALIRLPPLIDSAAHLNTASGKGKSAGTAEKFHLQNGYFFNNL
jgi:hypothetical protein